jgi:hypothetical protein
MDEKPIVPPFQFSLLALMGLTTVAATAIGAMTGFPELDPVTWFLLKLVFLAACPAIGAFIWVTVVDELRPRANRLRRNR